MKHAIKLWINTVLVAGCLTLIGCQTPIIPNMNGDDSDSTIQLANVRQKMRYASEFLNSRVVDGDISDSKAHELLTQYATGLIQRVDLNSVKTDQMWELGEVYRDAGEWALAEKALRVAVKNAPNEDRRINDTLRLARCIAMQGRDTEAIQLAQTVMNAAPHESAPILTAVYLEILPALKGKGHDIELADLLVKAIHKHLSTVVDLKTLPGRDFIRARAYHVQRAQAIAAKLYTQAGKADKAKEVLAIKVPYVDLGPLGAADIGQVPPRP